MKSKKSVNYKSSLSDFKNALKQNGLKFTKQREVVFKTLYDNDAHFTPESLYVLVKKTHPELNVGMATIYRTLNLLEESKMATSISFGVSGKKFELANKPHHDHMICQSCGLIIEFSSEEIEKLQNEIALKNNFEITSHLLQLRGICKQCRENQTKNKKRESIDI
ncbi:MAG: Fur family transcriptional regulator [Sulfurospirillaceae bacterium]|nr:Fur family transcriptional regulator [Sulfurospirillaceae bacterium]MDD3462393.1 Fur family transcriptional regulator [Sulfurospirillaceae bacterium]